VQRFVLFEGPRHEHINKLPQTQVAIWIWHTLGVNDGHALLVAYPLNVTHLGLYLSPVELYQDQQICKKITNNWFYAKTVFVNPVVRKIVYTYWFLHMEAYPIAISFHF